MLLSMTGFASKTAVISLDDEIKVNVSISIKSLNSRFFEATCKLPYILNHLETDVIKIFKKSLHRGHIYLTMHIKDAILLRSTVKPSLTTVKSYIEAVNRIKKEFSLAGEITINDMLNLPNIFNIEEQAGNPNFDKQIIEIIDQLIKQLMHEREKEGTALEQDLQERISIMQKEISEIETDAEILMTKKKEELSAIIKQIETDEGESADVRKGNLLVMLDKLDINEEIVRFKSHLTNLIKHINAPSPEKGKKIDFTLQELAREINTIAAKCSDATISSKAINIKVEIEKAREQTQNIV